jgi:hypothetical protein
VVDISERSRDLLTRCLLALLETEQESRIRVGNKDGIQIKYPSNGYGSSWSQAAQYDVQ